MALESNDIDMTSTSTTDAATAAESLITESFVNGRGTEWIPLSEENWERELEQVPLFMSTAPTADDIENNETLQAIQSLIYDGTPEEIAANFKAQGNEIVREKQQSQYQSAVMYYTKALAQKCGDQELNISCLLNRAQVNLELENYGSAIRDCQQALRLGPKERAGRSKALFRLCKSFTALDKLDEAQSALEFGMKNDPNNAVWPVIRKQIEQRRQILLGQDIRRQAEWQQKQQATDSLIAAINARGLSVVGGIENALFTGRHQLRKSLSPSMLFPIPDHIDLKPTIGKDENGKDAIIHWPVCLIYPQNETFDMVSQWPESCTVHDQINQVLSGGRDDFPQEYRDQYSDADQVAIYYPELKAKQWRRIAPLSSLQKVLASGCAVPEDGIIRLWIMPKPLKGGWTLQWIQSHQL